MHVEYAKRLQFLLSRSDLQLGLRDKLIVLYIAIVNHSDSDCIDITVAIVMISSDLL